MNANSTVAKGSNGQAHNESASIEDAPSGVHRVAPETPEQRERRLEEDSGPGNGKFYFKKVLSVSKGLTVDLVDAQHLGRDGCENSQQIDSALAAIATLRDHTRLGLHYAREAIKERRAMRARIAELEAEQPPADADARTRLFLKLSRVANELHDLGDEENPNAWNGGDDHMYFLGCLLAQLNPFTTDHKFTRAYDERPSEECAAQLEAVDAALGALRENYKSAAAAALAEDRPNEARKIRRKVVALAARNSRSGKRGAR